MIKELIKNTPVVGKIAIRIYSMIKGTPRFTTSGKYWDQRYKNGGNSGAGSYNKFAEFKAEIINDFVKAHQIKDVIEFGFGDGNQLKYFHFNTYTGFDVSHAVVEKCIELFRNDPTKKFKLVDNYQNEKADLTMSLDVIYHLTEDKIFKNYMKRLFTSANRFVIIYSSNTNENNHTGLHVKHRKFTDWIDKNEPEFQLIRHIPNKYPWNGNEYESSFADFYIYQKY